MYTIYANRFDLPAGSFDDALAELHTWMADYYAARDVDAPMPSVDEPTVTHAPCAGHAIESRLQAHDGDRLLDLAWILRMEHGGEVTERRLGAKLLGVEDAAELSLSVAASWPTFRVAPVASQGDERPSLVDRMLARFDCTVSGWPVRRAPASLSAPDLAPFCHDVLEHPDRSLPLVLISCARATGAPVCDPVRVQDRLISLANVYVLDPSASRALSTQVGSVRSCYNGALRLYWPGFTRRSAPRAHPYYLAPSLRRHEASERRIEDHLFEQFAALAGSRFAMSPRMRSFKRREEHARRAALLQKTDEPPEAWMDYLDETLDERDALREECDRLHARVADLQAKVQALKQNFDLVARASGRANEANQEAFRPATQALKAENLDSVEAALHLAEARWDDWLYIWSSAWQAAERSHYDRPDKIVTALQAIADLSWLYTQHAGKVGPWQAFFAQRGLKYAEHESETTMNLYGEDRCFRDEGRQRVMEKHITIGQADPHCVQIFFDVGDGAGGDARFHVGYCGPHLPYATGST